jgi:hypothetical protein
VKSLLRDACGAGHALLLISLLLGAGTFAQNAPPAAPENPQGLSDKIESLTRSLQQTQTELARSREEIEQLRTTMEQLLKRMDTVAAAMPAAGGGANANASAASVSLEEAPKAAQISQDDWDLLNARVEEQRQTKVESGSKFRLKLSGLALFNAFDDSGRVDNLDVPSIALRQRPGYQEGGGGASVRQSIIGLTGFGPVIFGARTSADLQMGFYGGLPSGYTATSSGIANLRLARMRLDWENTSVVAGLDYLFFSPNSPTTYMSVAVPGLTSAGNLWTWTPTLHLEQRFSGALSPMKVEIGILDPSSNISYSTNTNLRIPNAAETSRIPTYAARVSFNKKSEDRPVSLGISGVYSPQTFYGDYHVAGWAGMVDWKFSLLPRTELTGQFFTGRGIDGLGGVPENPYPLQNPLFYNAVTAPLLAQVGVIGGWSQFKFKWNARNEFNVAAGTGGRNSAELRGATVNSPGLLIPARNEMIFANYIFRPRSDLLFSAEYRRLRTYEMNGSPDNAGQFGLAVGFLF